MDVFMFWDDYEKFYQLGNKRIINDRYDMNYINGKIKNQYILFIN